MRWFKHFSDNHRGQSVQFLLDELGYFGPYFYYLIYELCAEKLEQKLDAGLSQDDCQFVFHQRVVCSASRAKPSTVGRALDAGQSCGLWTFSLDGVYIKINLPILLILLDSDSKKPRLIRAKNALKTRLDKEEDKDKEKELEKIKITQISAKAEKANAFIAAYCVLFKTRWGTNPSITAKDAGIVKRLMKTMDLEKFKTSLNAYFSMPDASIAKAKHPLNLFELKLNEVVVFSETGSFTTQRQAQQADNYASNMILLQQVREGKL